MKERALALLACLLLAACATTQPAPARLLAVAAPSPDYGLEKDVRLLLADFCDRHPEHARCAVPSPSAVPSDSPSPSLAEITPEPSPSDTPSVTPSVTPVVTPSPTVAPSPSTTVCAGTAVPSGANLQTAITNAPSGATLCLSGSYTTSALLTLKSNLTLVGPATITRSTNGPGLRLRAVDNVKLRDLTLVGAASSPGVYLAGNEDAHALSLEDADNVTLTNIRADRWQGDCIYGANYGQSLSDHVVVDGLNCRDNGRMGLGLVGVNDWRITNTTCHDQAFRCIDLEPDHFTPGSTVQGTWDVVIDGGVSTGWNGKFQSGYVDASLAYVGTPVSVTEAGACTWVPENASGQAARTGGTRCFVDGVVIRGWRVATTAGVRTGLWTKVEPTGYTARKVTVDGNTTDISTNYPLVSCGGTDGLTVTNNHQPGTGAFVAGNCTNVVQSGNTH